MVPYARGCVITVLKRLTLITSKQQENPAMWQSAGTPASAIDCDDLIFISQVATGDQSAFEYSTSVISRALSVISKPTSVTPLSPKTFVMTSCSRFGSRPEPFVRHLASQRGSMASPGARPAKQMPATLPAQFSLQLDRTLDQKGHQSPK